MITAAEALYDFKAGINGGEGSEEDKHQVVCECDHIIFSAHTQDDVREWSIKEHNEYPSVYCDPMGLDNGRFLYYGMCNYCSWLNS